MRRAVAPNAAEKRFHEFLAGMGCAVTGAPAHIHHAIGSSAKHNRIHIGQWWVIPLAPELHQGQGGIHGDMSLFALHGIEGTRKEIEKKLFQYCAARYMVAGGHIPEEVLRAVVGYRR